MNLSKMIMTIFGAAAFLVSAVVGQTPQITLKSIDGKIFELSEREGRFVVMYFDGTWNPMAEKTLPALEQLSDQFSGRDVDFYWVSINSRTPGEKNYASDQDLRLFAKEMGVSVGRSIRAARRPPGGNRGSWRNGLRNRLAPRRRVRLCKGLAAEIARSRIDSALLKRTSGRSPRLYVMKLSWPPSDKFAGSDPLRH